MSNLFCPVILPEELIKPMVDASIEYWNEKYLPRIVSENLRPHNLYVMPDVHREPYQNVKKYFFNEFELLVKSIILFPTVPNKLKDPHRDGPRNDYAYSAINIPVANVEKTYQVWWPNFDENRVVEYNLTRPDGTKSVGFDIVPNWNETEFDNMPNSDRLELLSPHIVNTNVIHGVDNRGNDNWRLILSIRFSGNPTLEKIRDRILSKRGYL